MWDQRYGNDAYFYGTAPNDFLSAHAGRFERGARILSLAEGEGRNAAFMAERGLRVTAVDSSKVGLAKAHRLAEARGVEIEIVHADLTSWPIEPAAWDGIVSIFCHLLPPDRARLYSQAVAGLRPGGLLLLEAYTPRQLELASGGPPTPELLVSLEQLRSELTGLDLLHAVELEREIREGTGHVGPSAVVQVIGRRPGATEAL